VFAKASDKLVRSGIEDRLIRVLRGLVEGPQQPHHSHHPHPAEGAGAKPGALGAHMAAVLKEFGAPGGSMVGRAACCGLLLALWVEVG